jgi:hypothetical protein
MITEGYNTIKRKIVNCVQGLISPTLANTALDGLEKMLSSKFKKNQKGSYSAALYCNQNYFTTICSGLIAL